MNTPLLKRSFVNQVDANAQKLNAIAYVKERAQRSYNVVQYITCISVLFYDENERPL